jgi:hypothetical protein
MSHVLLGEWGFLDNLNDTSGNGITASANFTPSFIDGPVPNTRAVRFSGVNQTVTYGRAGLEPLAAAGGIVTMVWAKLFAAHSNYTQLIHKTRASDSTRHAIDVSSNSVFTMSRWRDQIAFRESGGEFLDLGWHHICNVDSDDRYAWFVDGVLIQEASRSGSGAVSWEDFPWVSGKDSNMADSDSSASVAFTGVRILSGTLSNSEVTGWMNTPIVAGRSGKPKVWNGSTWAQHQAKVWNGSAWVNAKMAGYNGTDWITAK